VTGKLAIAGALIAGGAAFFAFRRRSTMDASTLAARIVQGSSFPPELAPELADAAIRTLPRDYFPELDPDAALVRWALLLTAISEHESWHGQAPGYFPKGDVKGWGDRGNAFGFWQIDRRFHWTFIQSEASQSIFGQALYAARRILAPNWARFAFIAEQGERERLAVIAYNASAARIETMIRAGSSVDDADDTTTRTADGTPYGADVIARLERMA
jgi:hypothetical protein